MVTKAFYFLSLVLLLPFLAEAQSIYSILQHDKPEDISSGSASLIMEENTFHLVSGKETRKTTKHLNRHNRVLNIQNYHPNGSMSSKVTVEYDSTGLHSLSRTIENWSTDFKYNKTAYYYSYDSNGFLTRQVEKDAKGTILYETALENNEQGHPEKLTIFDGKGNLIGEETATYDYDENTFQTRVTGRDNVVHASNPLPIDATKIENEFPENATVNELGHVVKTEQRLQAYRYNDYGERIPTTLYNTVKLYDAQGNWTETKLYEVIKKRKRLEIVYKRTIAYHE